MREIKFRGKRVDNGEWVYGYLFKSWEQSYILWGTTNCIPNMIEVIPKTVGQSTGRIDKKNKPEYAGDIIKQDRTLGIWEVIYEPPEFKGKCLSDVEPAVQIIGHPRKDSLRGDISRLSVSDFEIFGNIHDNPEF